MATKQILLLIALILALPFVSAEIEFRTYDASSNFFLGAIDTPASLCSCQSYTDKIILRNQGNFASIYQITTNLDYVTGPESVTLMPGEEKIIDLFVNVPCNKRPSFETYRVIVEDNYNEQKEIRRTLQINRCESVQAQILYPQQIQPCEPHTYLVNLTNPAPFTEDYKITFKSPINMQYSVTLLSNQNVLFEQNHTFECDIYGDKEIEVEIESIKNNLKRTFKETIHINRSYDFEVSTQLEDLCLRETAYIPITVTNNAQIENEFTLTGAVQAQFNLSPGQSQTTDFVTTPTRLGESTNEVIVTSTLGDIRKSLDLNTTTVQCHNIELTAPSQICDEDPYIFQITNTGKFEERVNVSTNVGDFILTLLPGEIHEEQLDYPETLRATATILDRELYKEFTYTQNTEVFRGDECRRVEILDKRPRTRYYEDFYLLIQNTGLKTASYDVQTTRFETQDFVELEPGQIKQLNFTTNLTEEEIGTKFFTVQIGPFEEQISLRIMDRPFITRATETISEYPCQTVLIILLIILVLGLIKNRRRRYFKRKTLFTIIIVGILLLITWPASMHEQTQLSQTNLTIMQGEDFVLDLNTLFVDPDGGELFFEMGRAPSLPHTINRSDLILRPRTIQTTNMTIIAIDSELDFTESPLISINVIPFQESNFNDAISYYCLQLIIILLTLIFIVFIFRGRRKRKKKTN